MPHFQTTSWSLVLHARGSGAAAREALEQLCRDYRPPVLAFVRAHGVQRVEAEDLTQAFFAQFLEQQLYASADPGRGRFRNLLLTALRHFLANAGASERAAKRGGGTTSEPLGEAGVHDIPCADPTPERAFELEWAASVIERALERLRDETRRAGKLTTFERLREFLLEKPSESDYDRVAAELGMRRNTLTVAVHRLRQRLREQIRNEICETTASEADAEFELDALRGILGAAA